MPKYRRIVRLTKEVYEEAKPLLRSPKDDRKVMRQFGFSQTTARKIRNTKDFDDYYARTLREHSNTSIKVKLPKQQPPVIHDLDAKTTNELKAEVLNSERNLTDEIINAKLQIREEIMNLKIAVAIISIIMFGAIAFMLLK